MKRTLKLKLLFLALLLCGGVDYVSIGKVTVGGNVGPVSESPYVYKP